MEKVYKHSQRLKFVSLQACIVLLGVWAKLRVPELAPCFGCSHCSLARGGMPRKLAYEGAITASKLRFRLLQRVPIR